MEMRPRVAPATHARRRHRAPTSPLRTAVRHVRNTALAIAAAAAGWVGMTALGPNLYAADDHAGATVSLVDRLYVDHDCAGVRRPDRPLLLVHTPAGGTQLVPEAPDADGKFAQVDWLLDQHGEWYGWCSAKPVR